MKDYQFTVVVERDEDGHYLVICPVLQGCYTEGETKEAAMELIKDAIRLHVQDRVEQRNVGPETWGKMDVGFHSSWRLAGVNYN